MNKLMCIIKAVVLYLTKIFISLWFRLSQKDPGGTVRETIYELIEQDEEDPEKAIDSDERVLLGNILDLKETFVYEIMIPRSQVVGINQDKSPEEALDMMVKNKINRLIVYKDTMDNVVGYVNAIECVEDPSKNQELPNNLEPLTHQLDAISPRMSILDLLMKMKHTGEKSVLVLDDHGGIEGLVVFNDLIQEIIGNIESDSHLNPPPTITKRPGELIVDGHVPLYELEESHGMVFVLPDDKEINTIAGYLCASVGRLPSRGELVSPENDPNEYLVVDASPRKIKRISIREKGKGKKLAL